jgi:CDP-diacylglycerol--serine O-phosphatidyltransferase
VQAFDGNLKNAVWLIVLAAFFDVLDGMMARLTNGSSSFGTELDSLADIVSFGVAPSFILFVFGLRDAGALGLVVSALPAICGAVRLARFNVTFDGEKRDYFVGLPIPAAATALMAVMLSVHGDPWFERLGPSGFSILVPVVIVLCALMISNIRFDTIPKPSPAYLRSHPVKALLHIAGFALVVALQQVGLLIVMAVYLVTGIGRATWGLIDAIRNAELPEDETWNKPTPT